MYGLWAVVFHGTWTPSARQRLHSEELTGSRLVPSMDSVVGRALLHKTPAERARLLGCVATYVTHVEFLNLLSNIDVNSKESLYRWTKPLAAFNSLESLWLQVEDWLRA